MAHTHKNILHSTWTRVNGIKMHARLAIDIAPRTAPAIVLVHGLSVSSRYMVPTAERLAPYYRVYVPDLPGFGKSAKPAHILDIPGLVTALADWMQEMEVPPALLLGHSLGSQIVVNFALRYPERITHAILAGPTMEPDARTIHQAAFRLLLDTPYEPLPYFPLLTREYLAAGLSRTIRTLQYSFADHMEDHLPNMHTPSLVIRGAHDPIAPQEWAKEVHRLLPHSELIALPGAGHAVNCNSPEKLAAIIRSFLPD
jgi:2-hydroxy-6-oxonona-2,4-dienedioate hydrolase